jgi:uncharacterized protein (DUF4415 family)/uncharacterized DUF497 family protein
VEFTRDARKDRLNRQKHRITFDTALHVFDDPYQVTTQDREVDGEPRWQTIGMVGPHNLLLVAHTADEESGAIRIVSAAKQLAQNGEYMPKATRKPKIQVRRQRVSGQPLTLRQKRELAALAAIPGNQIDTSDIPELPPGAWKHAVRGRFYRPLKQAISMRLDADVVAWLKQRGKGYQTRANSILRQRMLDETKRA